MIFLISIAKVMQRNILGNTQKVVIKRKAYLLPFLLLFINILIYSSSKSQTLNFANFSVDNGLSQNSVNAIVCDSFGLVWIATADGLNCYDGNKITQFHHRENDTNSLHNDYIYSLFLSEGQDIIIQGKEGIEYFDRKTGQFKLLLGILEMAQKRLSGRTLGGDYTNIWVLSDNYLIEINKFTKQKILYNASVAKNISLDNFNIISQTENKYQILFYDKAKLFSFDIRTKKISIIYTNYKVSLFAYNPENKCIYVITQDTILCLLPNGEQKSAASIKGNIVLNNVRDAQFDRYGNIWIKSILDGIYILSQNKSNQYNLIDYKHNIPIKRICGLAMDKIGGVWIGSDGNGAYYLSNKKLFFENYTSNQNLMVKSFCKLNDQDILVGTVANGLFLFNPVEKKLKQLDRLSNIEIYSFYKKSINQLLLGSRNGIFEYNITTYQVKPASLIGSDMIIEAKHMIEKNGILYVSHAQGLTLYDLKTNKKIKENPDIPNNHSCHLVYFEPGSQSYFLLTEYNGIWFHNGQNYIQISPKVFKNNFYSVRHIYRENDNTYWFATERGLLKIVFEDKSRTKHVSFLYTIQNGLPNNFIYSILPTGKGKLWLSTNKGLCEFDPATASCVNYDISDGLQSNEFNTGAYYSDQKGNMLFGGITGINYFNVNKIQNFTIKPNIFIDELSISGKIFKYIYTPDIIEIPYKDNEIVAGFYSDDISNTGKNKFYYLLEGLDKEWVDAQSLRQLRYAGLEPGKYILRLKTVNGDGLTSTEKTLTFIIYPPFWRTWWFILISSIILLFIIIYIVQRLSNISIKRKLKDLERKQEIESIRQRISSDLHDDIGSGLSKMALISELAKSQSLNPEELQSKLSKLTDNSRSMIRSLGEIVWAINPQNDKLPNLLAYMRDYASEYLETTEISVTYHIQESQEAIPINPDFKRNIFLILKESLHNAVKYSEATHIEIGFILTNDHYTFWVSDNGKGIEPQAMRILGHGLNSMKKRAETINAIYSLQSSLGKGVKITLEGTL